MDRQFSCSLNIPNWLSIVLKSIQSIHIELLFHRLPCTLSNNLASQMLRLWWSMSVTSSQYYHGWRMKKKVIHVRSQTDFWHGVLTWKGVSRSWIMITTSGNNQLGEESSFVYFSSWVSNQNSILLMLLFLGQFSSTDENIWLMYQRYCSNDRFLTGSHHADRIIACMWSAEIWINRVVYTVMYSRNLGWLIVMQYGSKQLPAPG